jgi:two-component system response regulator HydG
VDFVASPPDEIATLLRAQGKATPTSFSIVVLRGADSGKRWTVDASAPSRMLLGQGPACELRLTDPQVSRRHLALDATNDGLRLVDLGSTNGTKVNGLAVFDACLRGGEQIQIGETVLHVECTAASSSVDARGAARFGFGRLLGASAAMRRIHPLCDRLAASDVPVVIEGETGTGKELLAESIHEASARANGPFIVFDCTAVAPNLVESTLFGHERGAFTGAVASRKGVFEQANGGSLLIDEIGDLEPSLQPKLLRALQRSEVQRVGGEGFIRFDVRVMAATRRDLDREVVAGRFRDDLFFRLAVARIELPPLRERKGDVTFLARYFWQQLSDGSTELPDVLLERFEDWSWPGNVRELYNAVSRRFALGELAGLPSAAAPATLPPPAAAPSVGEQGHEDFIDSVIKLELAFPPSRQRIVDEFERRYLERVLARHGGSVARAAAASGIARRYFQIIRARQVK